MKRITSWLLCLVLAVSLFSATAYAESGACVEAKVDVSADGVLTLELTALQSVTNAKITVAYDADVLTFVSAEAAGTVSSIHAGENEITIGLAAASADAIGAGERVASAVFTVSEGWDESTMTVTVVNWNEKKNVNEEHKLINEDNGPRFDDVLPGAWYYEAVEYVADKGYFNGMTERLFAPERNMNRAMFVTVLYRMEGKPAVENGPVFVDVPDWQYYADAVAWASANGIVKGIDANHFDPERDATREEMATFLYRYAAYKGMDVTVEDADALLGAYPDDHEVDTWAWDAMAWAVDRGLIQGTDLGLSPNLNATRAQVAMILYRFDGLKQ